MQNLSFPKFTDDLLPRISLFPHIFFSLDPNLTIGSLFWGQVTAPDSWANVPENEVAVWLIKMEANAQWTIPPASLEVNRSLYFYRGSKINIAGISIDNYHSVDLLADQPVNIENGDQEASLLLLQGKPINEQVVQHGPFVMNSSAEIQEAFNDYRKTQFGGWPWSRYDNVHPRDAGRFAKYADGSEEIK